MIVDRTNPPSMDGGSDNDAPSTSLDDPANLDFYDPEEDNAEAPAAQESAAETVEADDEDQGQETEELAADADDETETEGDADEADEADADAPEVTDDVQVTLQTGEKLALSELKAGYMKQADYSRKTQELGTKRRELEALSSRVTASVEAVAEFLQASIPKAPDPNLAISNPAQYVREKALHDTAMSQVGKLIEQASAPKDVLNKLTAEQRTEVLQTENAKLIEAFPTTATPEGRKKFFEGTTAAAKELGFTDEDLAGATDHRLFKLAHYARIGLAAEQAKAKASKKVENVPPVAPNKRQPSVNASKTRKNQEAMKRLNRSGSIHDAMAIDFD